MSPVWTTILPLQTAKYLAIHSVMFVNRPGLRRERYWVSVIQNSEMMVLEPVTTCGAGHDGEAASVAAGMQVKASETMKNNTTSLSRFIP